MRRLGLSGGCILLLALALGSPIASLSAELGPAPIDEAQLAGRSEASFPQASEDFFHDMDNGVQLTPEQIRGRNMWLVWTGGNDRFWDKVTKDTLGDFRPPQGRDLASEPELLRRQAMRSQLALALARRRQRALLRKADRSRSAALRALARRAQRELRSRSLRGRDQVPGRQNRRPRHDVQGRFEPAGRLLFRLRHRHRRPALVSQSGLRPSAPRTNGTPSAITPIPTTTTIPIWCARTGSAWRAGSATSGRARFTRRPTRGARNGPISIQPSALSISGSIASSTTRPTSRTSSISWCIPIAPGTTDTSLVSTDYINNPRTMNAVYLLGPRLDEAKHLGQGNAEGRRAQQQAARGLLRSAGHVMVAARAEGRVRFGGRDGRAQSRLPQHRPL